MSLMDAIMANAMCGGSGNSTAGLPVVELHTTCNLDGNPVAVSDEESALLDSVVGKAVMLKVYLAGSDVEYICGVVNWANIPSFDGLIAGSVVVKVVGIEFAVTVIPVDNMWEIMIAATGYE